jgi:hypothetical protein
MRLLGCAQAWLLALVLVSPSAALAAERELAGYTLFPTEQRLKNLQGGAVFHDCIPGCLVIEESGKRICGPPLLDTGAPGINITSSNPADLSRWRKGDRFAIVFRNRQGGEVQANFRAGAGRPSQFSTSAPEHAGQTETHISAGTLPYFLFSAFYDDQATCRVEAAVALLHLPRVEIDLVAEVCFFASAFIGDWPAHRPRHGGTCYVAGLTPMSTGSALLEFYSRDFSRFHLKLFGDEGAGCWELNWSFRNLLDIRGR